MHQRADVADRFWAARQLMAPSRSLLDYLSQPLAQAVGVAIVFFAIAGSVEAVLIRIVRPTEMELDWVSDVVLSAALGTAVYLWRHLQATRLALTERERSQVVIQAQLSLAESMQRRLLPPMPPAAGGFEWAATLTPAGQIGGDFYDFVESTTNARLMLVADVSGKGISAAMALTLLRSTFRRLARETDSPAVLAACMSQALYDEWHGSPYVTCLIARVDLENRSLAYTNAGHPPGLLVGTSGDRDLREGGPPLGLLSDAQWIDAHIPLTTDDVCIFMTDGVTESFDPGERDVRAVVSGIVRAGTRSVSDICTAIMARAVAGQGPIGVDDWTDDRTVVVVRDAGQSVDARRVITRRHRALTLDDGVERPAARARI
jgi:serine phosphatase RsbU (regulator of sigma subunit)